MEKNLHVEALTTEDGDPWGVYAYGHIDPALLTLDLINEALDYIGLDPIDRAEPQHLWMHAEEDEDGGMPDYPWHFCPAGAEGAIAVTGIDFQA
ncbi:hypothetical protein [Sphingobium sp.]|uniref:hypothetical protein n=1 Tax=Sphingobium sp. TaxID=1912891 RepID=UPI002580CAFA|nr:hypothetical protein [Sphingobium sp.]MBR2268283.1 hypothetical protein [Sphingobium sp.]